MSALDQQEVARARFGPRESKDPRSREYAIQTLYALKRYAESLKCDEELVRQELERIDQYRHWEVLGYPSREAMLAAEVSDVGVRNVAAVLGKHGGDRKSEAVKDQGDPITLKRGTGAAYLRARLERDGRDDLIAEVGAGRMSTKEAARVAGYVRPTWTAPAEPERLAVAVEKRFPGWRLVRID